MNIFKFVLNTIPRPYLIKMSYLARPVLSVLLKGDTYIDPIDGKGFKRFLNDFYLTDTGSKDLMSYLPAPYH